jgi:hypothetical protein
MPSDPRDYRIDLTSSPADAPREPASAPARRTLGVYFACCVAYRRVPVSAAGTHYDAVCPRCGRGRRFVVGEGGTDQRQFVVR